MIFEPNGDISIRQSWLDTALRCGERGRLAIVRPDWDAKTGDSALIGTAAHSAIEQCIKSPDLLEEIGALARSAAYQLAETEEIKWSKYDSVMELAEQAAYCAQAWRRGIYPHIRPGGTPEWNFKVPLYVRHDGRTVHITGTIDYPEGPEGIVWDWKTSARKYRQHEKQKTAVQPTVYSLACVKAGLQSGWPVTFKYGVMIRGHDRATTQIVEVERTAGHAAWLVDTIRPLVDLAVDYGTNREWIKRDDHFLCNEQWCPWWSICRGAHITDEDRFRGQS